MVKGSYTILETLGLLANTSENSAIGFLTSSDENSFREIVKEYNFPNELELALTRYNDRGY